MLERWERKGKETPRDGGIGFLVESPTKEEGKSYLYSPGKYVKSISKNVRL